MRIDLKGSWFLTFALLFLALPVNSVSEELIGPTRSLQGPGKAMGKLTIVSEPPGLAVFDLRILNV